jgi:hypothetical protein
LSNLKFLTKEIQWQGLSFKMMMKYKVIAISRRSMIPMRPSHLLSLTIREKVYSKRDDKIKNIFLLYHLLTLCSQSCIIAEGSRHESIT